MYSSNSTREVEYLYGDIEFVAIEKQEQPILTVVIDTEEEFDWNASHSRSNTSVAAIADIGRVQSIFDDFGVRP